MEISLENKVKKGYKPISYVNPHRGTNLPISLARDPVAFMEMREHEVRERIYRTGLIRFIDRYGINWRDEEGNR